MKIWVFWTDVHGCQSYPCMALYVLNQLKNYSYCEPLYKSQVWWVPTSLLMYSSIMLNNFHVCPDNSVKYGSFKIFSCQFLFSFFFAYNFLGSKNSWYRVFFARITLFLPSNSWEIRLLGTIINYANLNIQIIFSRIRIVWLYKITESLMSTNDFVLVSGQKWARNEPEMGRKWAGNEP